MDLNSILFQGPSKLIPLKPGRWAMANSGNGGRGNWQEPNNLDFLLVRLLELDGGKKA